MNARALFIALSIAVAPAAARAELATDPFAAESPMTDAALAEARGGLVINGFLIDFAVRTTLIIDGVDSLAGRSAPVAFEFDPSINALTINNSLDDVEITRIVALDVAVQNFSSVLSGAAAANAGADASVALLSLSGF